MEEAEREREEGGRLRSIFGFSSTSSSLETTSAISRNNGCFVVPFLPLSHARRQRLRRDRRRPRFLSLATRGRKKAEAEGGSQRIYSFFFRCRHCRDGKVRAEKKLGRYFELFHFFFFQPTALPSGVPEEVCFSLHLQKAQRMQRFNV